MKLSNHTAVVPNYTLKQKDNKQNPSFKGMSAADMWNKVDLKGHNMPLCVLTAFTLGITLGARLVQARDKDERREVLTRDFIAISSFLFAVPALRKLSAVMMKNRTGIPLYYGGTGNKVLDILRPEKGIEVISRNGLKAWFTNVSKLKDGIVTFAENLSNVGGNLPKIFSNADEATRKNLSLIASELGVATNDHGKGLVIPATNEAVIKMLKDAKALGDKNPKVAEALKQVVETLDSDKREVNKIYEKAVLLKSIPEVVNFSLVAVFLGGLLPAFNIWYTKRKYKGQENQQQVPPQQANNINKAA